VQKIRIGARGSKLSLIQANMVSSRLEQLGYGTEIIKIRTGGDENTKTPLYRMDRVGVFVDKINERIADSSIDIAVHSAKDIPSVMDSAFSICAVLPRDDPRDTIISSTGYSIRTLPSGSRVGTSSLRRAYELKALRPDINIMEIRGNVDTRVNRVVARELDAVVLALAAFQRMHLDLGSAPLELNESVPAPNQGIIAVVCAASNIRIMDILSGINDRKTRAVMLLERLASSIIGIGCSKPAGIIVTEENPGYHILARIRSEDMTTYAELDEHFRDDIEFRKLIETFVSRIPPSLRNELK
jgi:hydroxymethylbilane synthase